MPARPRKSCGACGVPVEFQRTAGGRVRARCPLCGHVRYGKGRWWGFALECYLREMAKEQKEVR